MDECWYMNRITHFGFSHMLNKTGAAVDKFKQNIFVLFAPDYVPQNPGIHVVVAVVVVAYLLALLFPND
jgi:hypothetical protein